MLNRFVSKAPAPIRNRVWLASGLAALLLFVPGRGMSATEDPFRPFLGNWRGTGDIVATDGHREGITCQASYASQQNSATLTQSLICASDSYRLDVEGQFIDDGGTLKGHWRETTRNVDGDLSGQVGRGNFEGTVTGPGFTAAISVKSNGPRQLVSIRPSAGDIASVEVTLAHRR